MIKEPKVVTLREKQSLFVKYLGLLFSYATAQGWELTLAEGHDPDKTGHMPGSLHYVRLAQDVNLFVDGEYVTDGDHPAWKRLGQFWEVLDPICRWGGRFNDANHFSLSHGGKA